MTTLQGPIWSAAGLDIAAGRYPLAVERHVMRMADLLVPGVTTVTPHARYYALHALIADEAEQRGLSSAETQELLRRTEVALAAVSWTHEHSHVGLPRAHGTDALARRLRAGHVDVAEASQPGKDGYVQNSWGFWFPYFASEVTLGVLAAKGVPTPGPASDAGAVRAGLDDLLDLARRPELVVDDLRQHTHLCVCAGGDSPDGRWLAQLLCATTEADPRSRAGTRRETIRLITRIMQTHQVSDVTADLAPVIAFGDFVTSDRVTRGLAATSAWRGVILRNYNVGAWRRLWSWLVEQVNGLTPADAVADSFADSLPDVTVQAFLDQLPATRTPSGTPAPAEQQLRGSDLVLPLRELSVLAVNARRVDELAGHVRDAFLGDRRGIDLAPEWTARRFTEAAPTSLRDFARRLTADLLLRAQRVALAKARRRADGTLWLPTRLQERGGLLFKTSAEGRADVGLRLDQLTTVLAGAGVVARVEGTWQVTSAGEALLG
ncbi:hypothetical protein EV652_103388 [Kribbella steppae]|uniref:Uncharacterized protein n=1 Tax=Kribbella steppae TaxID=2512223 RepID=A0A4R2HQP3_9ACTN|nr:hypothetical protein [Kribbella steppae]TCO33387.1 hypothetical protein EV652_103388 [Kribbella steppae]